MNNIIYRSLLCIMLPALPGLAVAQESPEKSQLSQDTVYKVFNIDSLVNLTKQNNQTLKVSSTGVRIANQAVEVAKTRRLPTVTTALTAGYLGDASIIEKDFSSSRKVPVPHFANSFSVQASQVIFNGNAINNTIATASLQKQIAALNFAEDVLDVKLLVTGNYFDLYTLYNQRAVYDKNMELAELRLAQIRKLYHAGMVTRNDVIRSELQIADLKLARQVVDNNAKIVNKQLTVATGLPSNVFILPDTTILDRKPIISPYDAYENEALKNYPSLKAAKINTEIAERNLEIAKSDLSPNLSAYAGSNLSRPVTDSSPAADLYSHGWQAGLTLAFNIDALYKAPKNIKLSKLYVEQNRGIETLQQENRRVTLNAAYIKHNEAITQWETLRQNMLLANENYRIIEKKYLNQLALFIDMLDASNAKLSAELDYTNAEIQILYTYAQLQKETGRL
jgi:outer membrane protein